MTGAEFSEVDIDLLADYVGGALAGSPEEARVAALVADDSAWSQAYEQLSAATAQVSADLAGWGAAVEPMPADVAARLDAVLTTLELAPEESAAAPTEPRRDQVRRTSRPGGRPARRDRPTRPPGRRRRWTTTIGVAAVLVLFAGLGFTYLGHSPAAEQDTAESAGAPAAPPAADRAVRVFASGLDYTADTLADGPAVATQFSGVAPEDTDLARGLAAGSSASRSAVPRVPGPAPRNAVQEDAGKSADVRASDGGAKMFSLTVPLSACLAAIDAANGAPDFHAESVDEASYQGEPALIVRFSAANGQWAWASGADCGGPRVGARKLAAVRVR